MSKKNHGNRYIPYWTQARIEELRRIWFSGMPLEDIAGHYGVRPDTIYTWCSRRFKFGRRVLGTAIQRDPEKMRFMERNYPHMSDQTIAVFLDVSLDIVRHTAINMGLRKTAQFLAENEQYRARRIRESLHRRKESLL